MILPFQDGMGEDYRLQTSILMLLLVLLIACMCEQIPNLSEGKVLVKISTHWEIN